MNVLLTGDVGCGKTTVCGKIVERLEKSGLRCGGVICPAVRDECGRKIGSDAVDVLTKEVRLFTRLKTESESGFSGVAVGKYLLNREGVEFGKTAIENAVDCDLVVIDEIGLLELHDGGLMEAAVKALNSGINTVSIVRSRLRKQFLERFKDKEFRVFNVSTVNREDLAEEISRELIP